MKGGGPTNLSNGQLLQVKELFSQDEDIDEVAKILEINRKVIKYWDIESRKGGSVINQGKQQGNKAGVFPIENSKKALENLNLDCSRPLGSTHSNGKTTTSVCPNFFPCSTRSLLNKKTALQSSQK